MFNMDSSMYLKIILNRFPTFRPNEQKITSCMLHSEQHTSWSYKNRFLSLLINGMRNFHYPPCFESMKDFMQSMHAMRLTATLI